MANILDEAEGVVNAAFEQGETDDARLAEIGRLLERALDELGVAETLSLILTAQQQAWRNAWKATE